uniref:Uncharacterized protein n=1 Tax=mine drainage metagenome TaxID=410659 RepID=E6PLI9_9ZZZZ
MVHADGNQGRAARRGLNAIPSRLTDLLPGKARTAKGRARLGWTRFGPGATAIHAACAAGISMLHALGRS